MCFRFAPNPAIQGPKIKPPESTEAVEKRVIWGGRRMIFLDRDGWNAH